MILGAAIELLRESIPHPPLTFLWTVQEETGLHGRPARRQKSAGQAGIGVQLGMAVAPEKLTIGATGGYRMTIEVRGIASHAGGAPEQGVSAIAIAGLAIAQLQSKGWHGAIRRASRGGRRTSESSVEVTPPTSSAITCGSAAEARSHDPIFRSRIVAEIERAFAIAAEQVANEAGQHGEVSFDGRVDYESFRLADDSPTVRAAAQAVEATGKPRNWRSPTVASTRTGSRAAEFPR
ncbi:MAG: peptidase dimerization domain-containing protein [Pirellulaceae bacterium]